MTNQTLRDRFRLPESKSAIVSAGWAMIGQIAVAGTGLLKRAAFKRRSPAVARGASYSTHYINLEANQQVAADFDQLCIHSSVLLALTAVDAWQHFPLRLSTSRSDGIDLTRAFARHQ